jgi:hypothetical protein
MGDRANFAFKQPNGHYIVLYGHWAGHEMLKNLSLAIHKAKPRWTDEAYGTRIAISQMIGDDWDSETGWGLSIDTLCDNEHSIAMVDFMSGTFSLYEEGEWHKLISELGNGKPKFTMSLESFIKKYSGLNYPIPT